MSENVFIQCPKTPKTVEKNTRKTLLLSQRQHVVKGVFKRTVRIPEELLSDNCTKLYIFISYYVRKENARGGLVDRLSSSQERFCDFEI